MRFPTLGTTRLTIRLLTPENWQAVYSYTSNPQVLTFIPVRTLSEAQAQAIVAHNGGDQAEAGAVVLNTGQQLIGHIIFHPWFAPQTYEIG